MAILSPSELLDWLLQFQFLTTAQSDELKPLLATFPDTMALAKELIKRDWLTPFQVNQIMQERHDLLVVGEYRLLERIGEGAMGQVFKARNLRHNRAVAIKTLNKQLVNREKAMDRFRREAEAASHLDHPNIAHVREAGDVAGRPYMVMEFIDGVDLSKRVHQQGALPIHEAVEFTRQAALGLQHAFERGIVHRDIKPANLIVTSIRYNDETLVVVKILDFGLARVESDEEDGERLTAVGKMLGTIDYVAPEQATDARNADTRADIYSLGCTLFFLLSGKPPFGGRDVVEKLGPRVTGEAPWVRTVRADVPPGLEEVLRKMMSRRPEDRYQTPIEAALSLEPFVTAAPVAVALPIEIPNMTLDEPMGVAMAMPVSDAGENVPMAMPMPPSGTPASAESDPSFVGMTATGRDMTPGAARPATKKPFPIRYLVIGGGGVLLVLAAVCGCICLWSFFFPDGTSRGTLRIVDDPNVTFIQAPTPGEVEAGRVTSVWTEVERTGFKGPVKVSLEDLPAGVTGETKLIEEAGSKKIRLSLTVPFGMDPGVTKIRIHAESVADSRVSADLPMKLTIIQNKKFKKK